MIETHSPHEKAPDPRSPGGAAPERSAPEKMHGDKLQKQLDDALADSFPASDPVSIVTSHEEEDWGEP